MKQMKKVKLKDLKQGRSLFRVMTFMNKDTGRLYTCDIEHVFIHAKPQKNRSVCDSLFFRSGRTAKPTKGVRFPSSCSTRDWNIGGLNSYNLHRCFWKKKHAEQYKARIESGCYNSHELAYIERKKDRAEWDCFYNEWDWNFYC